ncbi:ArdC-like ssDNA-binding domain-containing protein [[Clostridium] aminophilum]|uniref:ArdC-like ssDNA-binding domain-containing protein n=1 Tax=[Clostridium] aminophilum TaxID=1526 RepID=UPI003F9B8E03
MGYKLSEEKKKKWQENAAENQKKAKQLIKEISENFSNDPAQIAEVLSFSAKFYKYSINNCELIKAQNPNAVYVQSFEAWKKMDAHVKRGEHGMKIWVPVKVTILYPDGDDPVLLSNATLEQKHDYEQGFIRGKQVIRFKIGTVFDVGQTDYPKEKLPEFFSMGYASAEKALIAKGLEQFSEAHGCPVRREDLSSIALRGYYDPSDSHISINHLLEDSEYLSTLSHEIGHMLQKHGTKDAGPSQMEFEADCISVVIQSYFGVELTDSRKRHLADHYKGLQAEIIKDNPQLSDEERIKVTERLMDSSLKVFRKFADEMIQYVDAELVAQNKEETLEKVIEQSIGHSEKEEQIPFSYSFTVYECQDIPSMGLSYTNISSVEEAFCVYREIPEYKKSLVGGINLVIAERDGSEEEMPLLMGDEINLDMLSYYPLHVQTDDGTKLIKKFCEKAIKDGYRVTGSCIGYNGEKLSADTIFPKKEENNQMIAAVRRHKGQ